MLFRAVNLFAPEAVAPGGRFRGLMPWRGAPSDARLTARVVHEDDRRTGRIEARPAIEDIVYGRCAAISC